MSDYERDHYYYENFRMGQPWKELHQVIPDDTIKKSVQKYYVVMAEPETIPLAMFTEQSWAREWKDKYCATAIVAEFDLALLGLKK